MPVGLMERIAPINTAFDPERIAIPVLAWAELPAAIPDKGYKFCTCYWVLAHRKGIPDCYDSLWIFIVPLPTSFMGLPIVKFPGGRITISGQYEGQSRNDCATT
jgi:hypothetical protein